MDKNAETVTLIATRTVAAMLLEGKNPVKKPGPGEATDPTVVALIVTPFRNVI